MNTTVINRQQSAKLAERDLLLSLFTNPAELAEVRDTLRPDDFHVAAYQFVFESTLRLYDRREPIDAAGVHEDLRSRGVLDEVPRDLFIDLAERRGGVCVQIYADRVLALSLSRGLEHAVGEMQSDLESPTGPPEEMLDRALERLDKLASRRTGSASVPIAEAVNRFLEELDARRAGKRTSGVPSGFRALDEALCGGLAIGQMTILGARPSVGKTAFALNVARNVCARGGAVYFASLEQRELEVAERVMAGESRVSGKQLRQGTISYQEGQSVSRAADPVRDWRFMLTDRGGQTAAQIAAGARQAKRRMKGLDLIVVDYLNLVRPENAKVTRNEQTGASALRLREMGRELNAPVLCLCQLNRMATDGEVPSLHHLRDSGEIEQVADVVMFLHRTAPMQFGKADLLELHIAKQRNGPLDEIPLEHECQTYTFKETNLILP